MTETTFIYGLVDPRTQELRYVGKTDNLKKRYKEHHCDLREDSYRTRWLKSLKRDGIKCEMFVIEEVPLSGWEEAERFWIGYFRFVGAQLVNGSDGGDSGPQTPEVIARRSASIKKTLARPEVRARLSASLKEAWEDPEYRVRMSEAFREVQKRPEIRRGKSEMMTKRMQDPEYRKKFDEHIASPEFREKQSQGTQRQWADPEARQKIVESRNTPEYKANMSAIRKQEWATPEMRKKRTDALRAAMNRPEVLEKLRRPRGPYKKRIVIQDD